MCKATEGGERVIVGIDEQHSKETKFRIQCVCRGEQEDHIGEGVLEFLGEGPDSFWREFLNCMGEDRFIFFCVYSRE